MSGKAFWIMLSNEANVVDMTDPIWNSRIICFHVLRLEETFLKLHSDDEHKSIYPLAWLQLFKESGCVV